MEALPQQKFTNRQWRFGRKRRHSTNEGEGLY